MLEYRQMIRKYIEGVVVEWCHLMGNYCRKFYRKYKPNKAAYCNR